MKFEIQNFLRSKNPRKDQKCYLKNFDNLKSYLYMKIIFLLLHPPPQCSSFALLAGKWVSTSLS